MAKSAQLIKMQENLKVNEAVSLPSISSNSPKKAGYDLVMKFFKEHEESGYIDDQLLGILLGVAHCNRSLAQDCLEAAKDASDPDDAKDLRDQAKAYEDENISIVEIFRKVGITASSI